MLRNFIRKRLCPQLWALQLTKEDWAEKLTKQKRRREEQ